MRFGNLANIPRAEERKSIVEYKKLWGIQCSLTLINSARLPTMGYKSSFIEKWERTKTGARTNCRSTDSSKRFPTGWPNRSPGRPISHLESTQASVNRPPSRLALTPHSVLNLSGSVDCPVDLLAQGYNNHLFFWWLQNLCDYKVLIKFKCFLDYMVQRLRSRFILPQKEDIKVFKLIHAWDSNSKNQSMDFF